MSSFLSTLITTLVTLYSVTSKWSFGSNNLYINYIFKDIYICIYLYIIDAGL